MTALREIFLQLLSMSLTSSLVIAVICFLRFLLKRAPKKFSYWLWAAAAFRLICPFSFSAVFSIFSFSSAGTVHSAGPVTRMSYLPAVSPAGDPAQPLTYPGMVSGIPDPGPDSVAILSLIWMLGVVLMLAAAVFSYRKICLRVRAAVMLRPYVYECDAIRSPFVLGFFRPKIYLPFGLDAGRQKYVLCHEEYHIRRRDYLIKPLAFSLLCLHWLNPLVWLAFVLLSRDMEMSCDEKVLETLGGDLRREYSLSLLSFGSNRRFPAPNPLSFGETGLRERIKNVLTYRRTGAFVSIMAVIACLLTAAACSANPIQPEVPESSNHNYEMMGAEDETDFHTAELLSLLFDCQDSELLEIMALPAPSVTPLPNGDYPTMTSNPAIDEALEQYYQARFPADYFTEEAYARFLQRAASQWFFQSFAGQGELQLVKAERLPAGTDARSWTATVRAVLLPSGASQDFEIPVSVQESEGKLTSFLLGEEVGSLQQYFFRSAMEETGLQDEEQEAWKRDLEAREEKLAELQAEFSSYEARIEVLASDLETAEESRMGTLKTELNSAELQRRILYQEAEALEQEIEKLRLLIQDSVSAENEDVSP